jgi:hypothetical protein
MKRAFALLLTIMPICIGCHQPLRRVRAGDFRVLQKPYEQPGFRSGVGRQIALYIPNRLVDLLEIGSASLGVGLGLGVDVRVTRWGQLAAMAGVGAAGHWDNRSTLPAVYGAAVTAAFGPWRTGAGAGVAAPINDWEIAVAGAVMKFGIDLAELTDFILGWAYVDILRDDYGYG